MVFLLPIGIGFLLVGAGVYHKVSTSAHTDAISKAVDAVRLLSTTGQVESTTPGQLDATAQTNGSERVESDVNELLTLAVLSDSRFWENLLDGAKPGSNAAEAAKSKTFPTKELAKRVASKAMSDADRMAIIGAALDAELAKYSNDAEQFRKYAKRVRENTSSDAIMARKLIFAFNNTTEANDRLPNFCKALEEFITSGPTEGTSFRDYKPVDRAEQARLAQAEEDAAGSTGCWCKRSCQASAPKVSTMSSEPSEVVAQYELWAGKWVEAITADAQKMVKTEPLPFLPEVTRLINDKLSKYESLFTNEKRLDLLNSFTTMCCILGTMDKLATTVGTSHGMETRDDRAQVTSLTKGVWKMVNKSYKESNVNPITGRYYPMTEGKWACYRSQLNRIAFDLLAPKGNQTPFEQWLGAHTAPVYV